MSPPPNTPPDDSNDSSRRWWVVLRDRLAYWLWYRWGSTDAQDSNGLQSSIDRGHEPSTDTDVRGVVAFSVGLLVLIGVCLIALIGLVRWFDEAEDVTPSRFADEERVPPPPRLQHDPAVDLAQLHRRTSERLHTYGWVNRSRDVVHIPIQRAMALVAERGLPYDTAAQADSVHRVISETGFAWEKRGPPPPSAPAYPGSGPEPFVPNTTIRRSLADTAGQLPNWIPRGTDSTDALRPAPNQ